MCDAYIHIGYRSPNIIYDHRPSVWWGSGDESSAERNFAIRHDWRFASAIMYATPGTNTLRCASESERNNSGRTVLRVVLSSARNTRTRDALLAVFRREHDGRRYALWIIYCLNLIELKIYIYLEHLSCTFNIKILITLKHKYRYYLHISKIQLHAVYYNLILDIIVGLDLYIFKSIKY